MKDLLKYKIENAEDVEKITDVPILGELPLSKKPEKGAIVVLSLIHISGLTTPLTMYVARHSWASIAKTKNISIGIISEAMGHDSETTTQIYLSSIHIFLHNL